MYTIDWLPGVLLLHTRPPKTTDPAVMKVAVSMSHARPDNDQPLGRAPFRVASVVQLSHGVRYRYRHLFFFLIFLLILSVGSVGVLVDHVIRYVYIYILRPANDAQSNSSGSGAAPRGSGKQKQNKTSERASHLVDDKRRRGPTDRRPLVLEVVRPEPVQLVVETDNAPVLPHDYKTLPLPRPLLLLLPCIVVVGAVGTKPTAVAQSYM